MTFRVAINGYGRIGQSLLRAVYQRGLQSDLKIVALNELADIETLAYLTRYDTTHGRFPLSVSHQKDQLLIGQDSIQVLGISCAKELPWQSLDIDLVMECSGSFSSREAAEQHLRSGAKRLLFSHPAEPDIDATVVYGFNHHLIKPEHRLLSAASCTTNCLIPVLDVLDKAYGILNGVTTTIHSAMNDQPVIDSYHHTDLRLTRSALHSIIPVDTGLSKGIDRLLPHLAGRFECLHVRVPTINVSLMDLSVNVERSTTPAEVNRLLKDYAESTAHFGLVGYTEEPHASVDFNGDHRSTIVDGTQTRVSGGRLLKLMCWFDNEWAYANRMLDVAQYWLNQR
ncbi:erythrose-4-phosphate dehydrogenase [Nitrincola tibetensis]|uniref:Erythrose-4-phosphate dehydrogenase n=1 Tax=Nitrincola tibetensis TaxID=2219697 RepID=A0A364NP76_9GAMM|nr:glyceraldehyde 3-phosphate dehydrogenase NAD-binding domain-containing protein [Nitrincola tibetensis]RAU18810.1 erythrose-4-phosphate dehydrogenase [Nitrincola tibetensis]